MREIGKYTCASLSFTCIDVDLALVRRTRAVAVFRRPTASVYPEFFAISSYVTELFADLQQFQPRSAHRVSRKHALYGAAQDFSVPFARSKVRKIFFLQAARMAGIRHVHLLLPLFLRNVHLGCVRYRKSDVRAYVRRIRGKMLAHQYLGRT